MFKNCEVRKPPERVITSAPSQPQGNSSINKTPVSMVPIANRVATMEAMILSVMSENAMPLSLAPVIVELAKACSSDPRALSEVKLSKCSAGYKIRFGLA